MRIELNYNPEPFLKAGVACLDNCGSEMHILMEINFVNRCINIFFERRFDDAF